jgi:hypothetical protein
VELLRDHPLLAIELMALDFWYPLSLLLEYQPSLGQAKEVYGVTPTLCLALTVASAAFQLSRNP